MICNKYIITHQINKLMILPPIQEHRGSPKQRKLRMYNNCAHAIDICFIFVILGLFSVFLLHIVLHKTFFFGECKREVIEEVVVCCSTLSLFRFLLSVREREEEANTYVVFGANPQFRTTPFINHFFEYFIKSIGDYKCTAILSIITLWMHFP